jgi:hypothetical protein
MAGAARELSGLKDNPRSSRSRFRGCRRHLQIHHRTSHAVILSMMGWQPHDSNLPAQAVFLDSGHEKSIHNRCSPERQCQLSLQPAGIRCILLEVLERLGFQLLCPIFQAISRGLAGSPAALLCCFQRQQLPQTTTVNTVPTLNSCVNKATRTGLSLTCYYFISTAIEQS